MPRTQRYILEMDLQLVERDETRGILRKNYLDYR